MGKHSKYEPVLQSDDNDDSILTFTDIRICSKLLLRRTSWVLALLSVIALTALASGVPCFFLGKHFQRQETDSDWFSTPGRIDQTFKYQKEFAMPPGNESEKYWDLLLPSGRGFVQHPEISPEPRGLAVFHQLHCLNTMRHAYWAAKSGMGTDHDHHAAPGHFLHCIDYLRQAIMCHADTNLELSDPTRAGVTGYGFVRKCRDFDRVVEWTDQWETDM